MTHKLLTILIAILCTSIAMASDFTDRIASIAAVSDVRELQSTAYPEKYVMKFTHPLDYAHPEKGSFTQRVIVGHVGFDRPTVLVTEGYSAGYATSVGYAEEISQMLNANLVFVEYRYFQESMPNPCNWDYLTVWNSLNDYHEIVTAFKGMYTHKWLSTGISKGGQTTMFYRAYFPDDVDVSVPYVAPLNKSVENGRHEPFLSQTVGTPVQRAAIKAFQIEILKRRKAMEPMLEAYIKAKGYTYNKGVTTAELLDMCVLEYAYAMWQWGTDPHTIPSLAADDKTLFNHLVATSDPEYFQWKTQFLTFFVQAARELGYYGYDDEALRPYLSIRSSHNYLHRLMLPAELDSIKFDPTLYRHTVKYLKENDPRMIFIYGENDPWSSSGVLTWLDFSKKQNMHLYVDPAGSHKARISTMPPTQREEATRLLKAWMQD